MDSGPIDTVELHSLTGADSVHLRLRRMPARLHLLCGHSSVYSVSLAIGAAARQPLAVIDGAMRFNSYMLSRIATALGIPAKALLRQTHVTRSFTAFQTEAAVTDKLLRFLASTPCPVVIVLGLLDTYYDEQVKPHECRQSLDRVLQTLRSLTARNIQVLIADVETSAAPPGKEALFDVVREAAEVVLRLEYTGGGFQLTEERSTLPWDATTTPSRLSSTGTGKHGASFAGH